MKTVLTLKYSSFLFFNKLSLVKNRPQEVDSVDFSERDIDSINSYIVSGSIHSTEGLFPVTVVEDSVEVAVTPVVEQEEVKEEVDEPVEVIRSTLDVLDTPVEVEEKKPAPKRTPAKKVK